MGAVDEREMERYEAVVMNKAAEADVMSARAAGILAAMVRDGGGAEKGRGWW